MFRSGLFTCCAACTVCCLCFRGVAVGGCEYVCCLLRMFRSLVGSGLFCGDLTMVVWDCLASLRFGWFDVFGYGGFVFVIYLCG